MTDPSALYDNSPLFNLSDDPPQSSPPPLVLVPSPQSQQSTKEVTSPEDEVVDVDEFDDPRVDMGKINEMKELFGRAGVTVEVGLSDLGMARLVRQVLVDENRDVCYVGGKVPVVWDKDRLVWKMEDGANDVGIIDEVIDRLYEIGEEIARECISGIARAKYQGEKVIEGEIKKLMMGIPGILGMGRFNNGARYSAVMKCFRALEGNQITGDMFNSNASRLVVWKDDKGRCFDLETLEYGENEKGQFNVRPTGFRVGGELEKLLKMPEAKRYEVLKGSRVWKIAMRYFGAEVDAVEAEWWTKGFFEVMGYCAVLGIDQQIVVQMVGATGTGKSAILDSLRELLGDRTCEASVGYFLEGTGSRKMPVDFESPMFIGRTPLFASEPSSGKQFYWDESKVKQLSGKSGTQVRRAGKDSVVGKNTGTLIVDANHVIKSRDSSGAIERRMVYFWSKGRSLERHEMQKGLWKVLAETEADSWLMLLADGYRRFRARGEFDLPPEAWGTAQVNKIKGSELGGFVRDRLMLDPKWEDKHKRLQYKELLSTLFEAYKDYRLNETGKAMYTDQMERSEFCAHLMMLLGKDFKFLQRGIDGGKPTVYGVKVKIKGNIILNGEEEADYES